MLGDNHKVKLQARCSAVKAPTGQIGGHSNRMAALMRATVIFTSSLSSSDVLAKTNLIVDAIDKLSLLVSVNFFHTHNTLFALFLNPEFA